MTGIMNTCEDYESPSVETIEIQTESAVLISSFTGEGINEWEDM